MDSVYEGYRKEAITLLEKEIKRKMKEQVCALDGVDALMLITTLREAWDEIDQLHEQIDRLVAGEE